MAAKGKGKGKGAGGVSAVEEDQQGGERAEEPEQEAGEEEWDGVHCMTLQRQRKKPARPTMGMFIKKALETRVKNKYSALATVEEDTDEDEDLPPLMGSDDECDCCSKTHSSVAPVSNADVSDSGACSSEKWIRKAVRRHCTKVRLPLGLADEEPDDEEWWKTLHDRTVSIMIKAPKNPDLHDKLVSAIGQKAASRCKGVKIIVDSGACDHVMPKDMVKNAPVKEGESFGVNYVGADGGTFPNLGEQKLCLTVNNTRVATTSQLADIKKPVLSVSKLTQNGCDVKFNRGGGTIATASGARLAFKRYGGVYVLTADVGTLNKRSDTRVKPAVSPVTRGHATDITVAKGLTPSGSPATQTSSFMRPG